MLLSHEKTPDSNIGACVLSPMGMMLGTVFICGFCVVYVWSRGGREDMPQVQGPVQKLSLKASPRYLVSLRWTQEGRRQGEEWASRMAVCV